MNRIILVLFVLIIALQAINCKSNTIMNEYQHPRKTAWAHDLEQWQEETNNRKYFVGYDQIITQSSPSEIEEFKHEMQSLGESTWLNHVQIIYKTCLRGADFINFEAGEQPENWEYKLATQSPYYATRIAAYENQKRGVDWFTRDSHNNRIIIYGSHWALFNWSDYCPEGAWNGEIVYQGKTLSIGDTRGKTVFEWISGPMKECVILDDEFIDAYDGFAIDDDNFIGVPSWKFDNNNKIKVGDILVSRDTYDWLCKQNVVDWHNNFAGTLNRQFIMMSQSPYMHPGQDLDIQKAVFNNYNGTMYAWYRADGEGGWPCGTDYHIGWSLWDRLDESYNPYGIDNDILNKITGVNATQLICRINRDKPLAEQNRRAREALGHALMHDCTFALTTWDDEMGWGFTRGDKILFDIPQMHFKLGKAMSKCVKYNNYDVWYRYFQKDGKTYTVVTNMESSWVNGISPRDTVWFEGIWPYLNHTIINFNK